MRRRTYCDSRKHVALRQLDLPEDPAELRRFMAAALAAEVHAKTLLIEKLRMQLSDLAAGRASGDRAEKLDRQIEQLELLLGDIEES